MNFQANRIVVIRNVGCFWVITHEYETFLRCGGRFLSIDSLLTTPEASDGQSCARKMLRMSFQVRASLRSSFVPSQTSQGKQQYFSRVLSSLFFSFVVAPREYNPSPSLAYHLNPSFSLLFSPALASLAASTRIFLGREILPARNRGVVHRKVTTASLFLANLLN